MTQAQMKAIMETMVAEEMETRAAGQKEYAHDSDNAFRNFEAIAKELHLDRKMVLWVYFKKHLDGILAHINGHTSQRENVRGRIKDARVYLALLRGMVEEDDQNAIVAENLKKLIQGSGTTGAGAPNAA